MAAGELALAPKAPAGRPTSSLRQLASPAPLGCLGAEIGGSECRFCSLMAGCPSCMQAPGPMASPVTEQPNAPQLVSELSNGSDNEDFRAELTCIEYLRARRGPGGRRLRLLVVASGGDGVLSLCCLPGTPISRLAAVDVNAAQTHLLHLKRAAATEAPLGGAAAFLGLDGDHGTAAGVARRAAYAAAVRLALPINEQAYWDARLAGEVSHGAAASGALERLSAGVRRRLAVRGVDIGALLRLERDDAVLPGATGASNEILRAVLGGCLSQAAIADAFQMESHGAWGVLSGHLPAFRAAWIEGLMAQLASRLAGGANAAMHRFFAGRLPEGGACGGFPLYLTNEGAAALRATAVTEEPSSGADCVHLTVHVGDAVAVAQCLCREEGAPFDLITLSNIGDWMSDDKFCTFVKATASCLADEGILLQRRMVGRQRAAFEGSLHVDEALLAAVAEAERTCVYWRRTDAVMVGVKRRLA
eukprot:SM000003S11194  [mRNA]  locus=s3:1496667:1499382:+ [translate_table: standard]